MKAPSYLVVGVALKMRILVDPTFRRSVRARQAGIDPAEEGLLLDGLAQDFCKDRYV